MNARVSVFVEPSLLLLEDLDQELEINKKSAAAANVPYQSSQKSSHNISGTSKKSDESLKAEEKEIIVLPPEPEEENGIPDGLNVLR